MLSETKSRLAGSFKDYLKQQLYEESTCGQKQRLLGLYCQWLAAQSITIEQATAKHLTAYLDHCKKRKLSASTTRDRLMSIRQYYAYLVNIGTLTDNPAAAIRYRQPGPPVQRLCEKPKVSSFKNYLKQKGYATTTIEGNCKSVLNYLTWLDMENLEPEQVRNADLLAYISYCKKRGLQQRAVQSYIHHIKKFYAFKISTGKVKYNPAAHIKIQGIQGKKLYYTFTPEELHHFYNSYNPENIPKRHGRHPKEHLLIEKRNKVMLGLYIYQGIQTKELIKLEVKHIRLREGQIEIPGTKRSETRTLQLESHQVLDLYDYVLHIRKQILEISNRQTQQLFVSPKGGNRQTNYVNTILRELKRHHKQIVNVQQLRTSVIVKWLRMYNLREAQYRAGHRYVSSTENFLVNETEGLAEEINQFHPLG